MQTVTRRFDAFLWGLAFLAVLPCFLLPLYNPDLFWHLSAAKRMFVLHAIPTSDWLSMTRAGEPWIDFEWASELVYGAVYFVAGMAGLWILKMLLLAAIAAVLIATLRLYRLPALYRAAGLAAWAVAMFSRSDIRPDLFSVLGFGLVLFILESGRLRNDYRLNPLWMILVFSIWAKLHAGFAYGLLLILLYAIGDILAFVPVFSDSSARSKRSWSLWVYLGCALIGTLLQPFHFRAYWVLWRHWRDMGSLTVHVYEWGPARMDNPWHWPYWVLLVSGFGTAAAYFWRGRRIAFGPLAALLVFGISASQHVRHGAFYAAAALPLSLFWGWEGKFLLDDRSRRARAAVIGLIAVCGGYSVWWGSHFGLFRTAFHPRFVPLGAGEFLAQEKSVLGGRPMYHNWGWGGYLGWRLYPDYLVFQDGRYIFNELFDEEAQAAAAPEAWRSFLDRYGIQTVVMENIRRRLPTTRLYPDGSSKNFPRPYYVPYMPQGQWALVYWDNDALIFRRRFSTSADWLSSHEYRYARPFDDDALADALRRNEIPAAAVEAEFRRHRQEVAAAASRLPRW